jgi:hypothetical protein
MYQNGYSDDDAQQLLRFVKEERNLALRRSDAFTWFRNGAISAQQMADLLINEGYAEDVVAATAPMASLFRNLEQQKDQIAALVRQYRACRISEDEFRQDAADLNIPPDLVDWHLEIANVATLCGTRRESAANLCTALDQQIIAPGDYVARMTKLRYDETAIQTMLTLCQNKIAARLAKQELAQQKAAQAEADKEKRQAEQAAAKAERLARQAQNTLEKMERGRQARNKLLQNATSYLVPTLGGDPEAVRSVVDTLYETIMQQYGLTQNEAATAVSLAAVKFKGTTADEFTAIADAVAQAALKEPWQLFPVG